MTITECVSIGREMVKNVLMGSRVVAAIRSRGSSGRMPIGRSDVAATHAHTMRVWDQYAEALRAAGLGNHQAGNGWRGGGWWTGKAVLEIGPGTNLGVQVALLAAGAARADALDRFGGVLAGEAERELYQRFIDGLDEEDRQRIARALVIDGSGVAFGDTVRYYKGVRLEEASEHISQQYDVILAHESLEHVEHLDPGIRSVWRLLNPGGLCVFVCHLASLGGVYRHETEPLRLLYYPDFLWRLMFSSRGGSNRVRASGYRRTLAHHGFEILSFSVLERLSASDLGAVKPHFARRFRDLGDDDLAILKFSVVARKP